jgi:hypothetical protein
VAFGQHFEKNDIGCDASRAKPAALCADQRTLGVFADNMRAGFCAYHTALLVAPVMGGVHVRRQAFVVVAADPQAYEGRDVIDVVIRNALPAADMIDRTQRRSADLADSLGDVVYGRG